MSSSGSCTFRLAVGATASVALLALGMPSSAAAPASDGQGYVDSTARCAAPNTVVVFGSTDSSRVAICKTPGGQYQYRGVRVRDGARLIAPASRSGDGDFVADNDAMTYTVTSSSLEISVGGTVVRDEAWVDFHGRTASTPKPPPGVLAPTTTVTPTTPLPPPLPAEVGGSSS